MDRTRYTGNLVSDQNLYVDIVTDRVGIGTTNPTSKLNVVGDVLISGIITATNFIGNLTGTASTASFATTAFSLNGIAEGDLNVAFAQTAGISTYATALQTSRTFEITGDVVASPISFDGTGNVSLAATIQPNSVELGTDTFGNYVATIADAGDTDIVVNNSGTETAAVTLGLTTTGVTAGSYGSSSQIPTFTVDSRGRLTAAGTTTIGVETASKSVVKYTATDDQTSFAATYEIGYVDVYLNGVKLTDDLYDATSGSAVILNDGAAADDIVEIVAFKFTNVSATRNTETLTIGSIASGVTTVGTVTLPKTGVMISINPVGDASGWFRLYTRSDLADADASRARTQDPDSGSGVILETITSGISTVYFSPQTIFANAEDTPINTYNYRFTKDGSAGITTFTFKYLSLES